MHLEARIFSIQYAEHYGYQFQFLQVIEDKTGSRFFETQGT